MSLSETRMNIFKRGGPLALAGLIACTAWQMPAHAESVLGELRCTIDGGFGVVVSAFRNLHCAYNRANGVIETYAGYTGFVDVGLGINPPEVAIYDVILTTGEDVAGLQGDYDTRLPLGWSDAVPANALIGRRGVYLSPRSATLGSPAWVLNKVSSLEQLHLIYAGVAYPSKRTATVRR